ncbi:MAG: DUF4340 domain-containing protein [Candidatus Kerfeldbacteria bacterium]|nr:DUF4340 domain-containing protein [Candidatus Kerfeldbacteria bacterium]
MRKQHYWTYSLLVIVVGLGAVVAYRYYATQRAAQNQQANKYLVQSFDSNAVTAITVTQHQTVTELTKQADGSWLIANDSNVPANQTAITNLLSTITHSTIQAVSARTMTTPEQYGLNPDQAIQVIVKQADTVLADIIIGKIGSAAQTLYAQRSGDVAVYLVSGQRGHFAQTDWAEPNEQ